MTEQEYAEKIEALQRQCNVLETLCQNMESRYWQCYCEADLRFPYKRACDLTCKVMRRLRVLFPKGSAFSVILGKLRNMLQRSNSRKGMPEIKGDTEIDDQSGPILLIVDARLPIRSLDAGSRTMHDFARSFKKLGWQVWALADEEEPTENEIEWLESESIGVVNRNVWQDWVKLHRPYVAFLSRPYTTKKYIDFFLSNTNSIVLYYGHDLHFVRENRNYEQTGNLKALEKSQQWKEIEKKILKKADISLFPSQEEVNLLKTMMPEIRTQVLPAYIAPMVAQQEIAWSEKQNLLFVGGFAHEPNADAMRWFLKQIWPQIAKSDLKLKVHIVGAGVPEDLLLLRNDRVCFHGGVSDWELEYYYASCRICIAPLRFGAGVKGKIIEAIQQGLPVITTSVGAEGIPCANNHLIVADSSEDFADQLIRLYPDEERQRTMARQAAAEILPYFSAETMQKQLKAVLSAAQENARSRKKGLIDCNSQR